MPSISVTIQNLQSVNLTNQIPKTAKRNRGIWRNFVSINNLK